MTRRLLLLASLAAAALLTACASRCPHMTKLMPMVGKHRFEGYRAMGHKIEIGGTVDVGLTPDRSSLLLLYKQIRSTEEEGFGEIHWDADRTEYVLTWEASGFRGGPLTATGFVHADGRLIFEGSMPAPSADGSPARFIYTFTFPERGKFILTIRHPGRRPNQVYESFRITADRIGSEPSRRKHEKTWTARRDASR